jgi:dihydroorotase
MNSRRRLILAAAASAATAVLPAAVRAAMGPNDKFDLRDPRRRRPRSVAEPARVRDIGIRNGVIEAVEASIRPSARNACSTPRAGW